MERILKETALEMGIAVDERALSRFSQYYHVLLDWNKRMNLTAITEEEEVAKKHFLDSISPLTGQWIPQKASLIDVGTGAGFPGIPLKIVREDLKLTLLDSLQKRVNFLEEVTGVLGLTNIEIYHGRAEDYGRKAEFRGKFDIGVSRAVAELPVLLELVLPFIKIGGLFIAYKGPGVFEEIEEGKKALELLGGRVEDILSVEIPGTDLKHYLTIVRKSKQTPTKYPRKAGKPERSPIK
ncbi:MAG: 16S rRNA (guanine(527)-N(7))-methyltransferase RsmG [Clostridia bacterium]|jgi:16S rRNA (guanine527-N7)-methyltransferase